MTGLRLLPTSLRGRLVLGAVGVGLTFAVVFGVAAGWRLHHAETQAIDAALQARLGLAREQVSPAGLLRSDPANPKTDLVQVIGANGTVMASSAGLRGVGALVDPVVVGAAPRGLRGTKTLQSPDVDLATLAVLWPIGHPGRSSPEPAVLLVAVDTEGFTTANDSMAGVLGGGLVSVVLVLAFLAWIVSGRALRSVRRLTERAERVDPRDLRDGLPVPDGDAELSQLVLALNRMLSRLHNSHATELAFAANAGHRLRTPVATLRAEAELALGDSDPSHRTAALHQIIADADQLTFIVDRMLARSRPPGSGSTPTIAVFERAATRWQRQASIAGVDLTVVAPSGLSRELRCPELLEILDPIVDNAVRHTDPGGHILISAQLLPASGAQPELLIEVANTGHPVPADLAAHIFDAWVSTREGSQAGGLGLWVARETARDVGGDVWLTEERPGTTTRFEIRLPTLP